MREVLPTSSDIRNIYFKVQRKKNIIPQHANLTWKYNREIVKLFEMRSEEATLEEISVNHKELEGLLHVKRKYEDLLFEELRNKLESKVLNPPASIRLRYRIVGGRKITMFDKNRAGLMLFDRFASQHLTRAFGIRAKGRDQCVRVLVNTFRISGTAKSARQGLLKMDIQDFYASVDHEILLRKIEKNAGVPRFVKQHVRMVLAAYSRLHGVHKGIPEGVPSSAVLAEIYLEKLDTVLRRDPGIALYLRYVDDIVIVSDPEFLTDVDKQVCMTLKALGLSKNNLKSKLLIHPTDSETSIEYLGYKFIFEAESSKLKAIDLSDQKFSRYLEALTRMSAYADTVECWATQTAMGTYLALHQYLLRPHMSAGASQGMRIVTGLAYSGRFMSGKIKDRENFNSLLNSAKREVASRWAQINAPLLPGQAAKCQCCSLPIPRWNEIVDILQKSDEAYEVMGSPAKRHESEAIRDRIGGILWS